MLVRFATGDNNASQATHETNKYDVMVTVIFTAFMGGMMHLIYKMTKL